MTSNNKIFSPEAKAKMITGLKIAGGVAAAAGAVFVGYQAIKGEEGNVYAETLKNAFDNTTGTAAIVGAVAGAGIGMFTEPVYINDKPVSRFQNVLGYTVGVAGLAAASNAVTNTTEFVLFDNAVGG